jgi:hypothetical protein
VVTCMIDSLLSLKPLYVSVGSPPFVKQCVVGGWARFIVVRRFVSLEHDQLANNPTFINI